MSITSPLFYVKAVLVGYDAGERDISFCGGYLIQQLKPETKAYLRPASGKAPQKIIVIAFPMPDTVVGPIKGDSGNYYKVYIFQRRRPSIRRAFRFINAVQPFLQSLDIL